MSPARLAFRTLSIAALAVAFTAGAARAPRHTTLVRSEPAKNSTVTTAPREIVLYFSEPIDLKVSKFKLAARGGDDITLGAALIDSARSEAPVVIQVRGAIASGVYNFEWSVGADDGHPAKGTFRFTVK